MTVLAAPHDKIRDRELFLPDNAGRAILIRPLKLTISAGIFLRVVQGMKYGWCGSVNPIQFRVGLSVGLAKLPVTSEYVCGSFLGTHYKGL